MGKQDPMTEHPDNEKAADEEQEDQEESQQGASDPGAAVEPDIPMPVEDSELSEGA